MRVSPPRYGLVTAAMAAAVLLSVHPADAYVGPGGVISGIGTFLALIAAVVAALFGFLWFPIKRLWRRMRRREPDPASVRAEPPDKNP